MAEQSTIHIFLSHGMESGPGGTKIQALKTLAETSDRVRAYAVDHRSSKDPAVRLTQMQDAIAGSGAAPENIILAGSSMGGWVCAQFSAQVPVLGCFLLAPALALPNYPQSSPHIQASHVQIIHGWDDDIVPVMPVVELARQQSLPALMLADGHRLENSLDRIVEEFRMFLSRAGIH
ncbi:YqiA/YcfP family alpha/beta fold hydrolase [Marinobacter sp.]|uniref:YqiA/YcfP family alpha/beta fold hydrolase n=1 Tax=Marinobacter sp. TaxID=50741 RepID=UPI003A956E40